MDERLPGRAYYGELKTVQENLVSTLARLQALDLEEKPEALVGTLSLGELVHILDHAIELADDALRTAQIGLAVEGVAVEDQDL